MPKSKKATNSGVAAIAALAMIYGLTAILARFLSHGLGLYEQWYLRYGIAFLLTIAVFHDKIDFKKFRHLPAREWAILVFRTIVGSVIAVALYTVAAQDAKIGPVAFMQVVPTTALLGVVLFREKISLHKGLLVLLSFIGASIVVVGNAHDLVAFNRGELLSLISGALFGLALITRKWHAKNLLNNYEITVGILGLSFAANYVLSLALYQRAFIANSHWTPSFSVVLACAGTLSVAVNLLSNYGFEHVSAVVASNILDLEQVFGALFGYVFYRETLTHREFIGGLVILVSVVLMNEVTKREKRDVLEPVVAPD